MTEERVERFLDDERVERFRRRLPQYRQTEYFQEYDIVKVQYLLSLLKRGVQAIEVAPLADLYGFCPDQQSFFFKVDREGAMSKRTNLTRPLIGVRGRKYPIIDGLHRLYKAAHTEQQVLPCLFLFSEEARLCER